MIETLIEKNIEVAMCAGRDLNYKNPHHVKSYELPVPSPLGLPKCFGKHVFRFTQNQELQLIKKSGALMKYYI